MCVIYACTTALPPEEELRYGAWSNDDGAGVAWLAEEEDDEHNLVPVVKWKKGLADEKAVLEFIEKQKLPFPLAIHFRTASIGGKKASLCHPFPMISGVPNWLEGSAPNVLFHNGHIHKWEEWTLQLGLPSTERWPQGSWSDSRALAWAAYLKGENIIPWLMDTSRVLVFSAEPYEPEGETYNRAVDHFSLFGNWIKKNGWQQSIDTYARMANRRVSGWVEQQNLPVVGGCEVQVFSPKPPDLPTTPPNVWTIEDLQTLIATMEGEQRHAQLAAGA